MDDPAYIESHKTRSKSSTCVNREDLYGERSTVQCREPENHEHREPKFHRHSFPNHNFENSLDIPLIDKEINGGEYKNTSQHINGYNQAPLNPEFMIVNEDVSFIKSLLKNINCFIHYLYFYLESRDSATTKSKCQ